MGQQRRARRAVVRASPSGKLFDYKQTKFWAERGLVHTVHEVTGEYTSCSVREWLLRAQALSRQAWREKYPDEREELITLVEFMVKVARQAKAQGDPHTADGVAEAVRRLPTRVSMPEVVYSYRGEQRQTVVPGVAGPSALILPGDAGFK